MTITLTPSIITTGDVRITAPILAKAIRVTEDRILARAFRIGFEFDYASNFMGCYASRSDLEKLFGKDNICVWADLDNDEDETLIRERIEAIICDESAIFDDLMRCHSINLPLPSPPPQIIRRIVALKSGVTLYGGRGYDDGNVMIRGRNKEADRLTQKILSGQIHLDSTVSQARDRPGFAYED